MISPTKYLNKRYKRGDGHEVVVGVILDPAIILKNPVTGEQRTVVIGCLTHNEMQEVSGTESLKSSLRDQHLISSVYQYLKESLDSGKINMFCGQEIPEIWIRPHLDDVLCDLDAGELTPVWRKT
jgi:hypothetical protein